MLGGRPSRERSRGVVNDLALRGEHGFAAVLGDPDPPVLVDHEVEHPGIGLPYQFGSPKHVQRAVGECGDLHGAKVQHTHCALKVVLVVGADQRR